VITLSGLGVFLALQGTPGLAGLVAAVLLALGYALDSADGQLARLQGSSSKQGEWLDHTLDAIRLPAVHLTIATALLLQEVPAGAVIGAVFAVIASASFLSQNVGGLLRDTAGTERTRVRQGQSWILLPADPGVLCWLFAFWVSIPLFLFLYALLLVTNLLHMTMSTRRRWRELA
jgi:phosphatidylglycerophosphate synthase